MNQVYSTKDKENLLIDEDMMNEEFRALAFMYNTENGTIQVKIARDNEEDVMSFARENPRIHSWDERAEDVV